MKIPVTTVFCLFVHASAFVVTQNRATLLGVRGKVSQHAVTAPLTSEVAVDDVVNAPEWVRNLDYEGFQKEVTKLGKMLLAEGGQEDIDHLNKIVKWRNTAAAVGILTMALPLNPVAVVALSTWTYSSWTMIAHHVCHGGYNRIEQSDGGWSSRGFALGNVFNRVKDWCDWMLPEAWNVEHNRLHHYHLGEPLDPDLVERNLQFLRDMKIPMFAKYATVVIMMPFWKWFYYAPNTFKELQINEKYRREKITLPEGFDPLEAITLKDLLNPNDEKAKIARKVVKPVEFFQRVLAPFLFCRFFLLPAPLLFVPSIGPALFGHAIANLAVAEMATNIHSFITIVTNHAGNDLYKFDDEVKPRSGSFYVRQIVSSTNYDYGSDIVDFSHGWLNYQIEHHVWPDLSMLQYQKGAPLLRQICDKYGVPYIKENVFIRTKKTVDIMVGNASMIDFPTELEPTKDKAGPAGVTWKSSNGAIEDEE